MSKWIAAAVIVLTFAASASADYVTDRKAAMAHFTAGKHEQALAAFSKLAETATSDNQKSDALQQATLCANRLQQYDRAMELAQQIPLAPLSKLCQMQVMASGRQWQVIVDRFQEEDMESWPESVQGDTLFLRGEAYFITKNGAAAEQDLKRATEYLTDHNSKGLCLNMLGDTYWMLLKDDKQAIETYRQVYLTGNVYKHCQAAMCVASILEQQQDHTAAIQELNRIDLNEVTAPYWRGAMLGALGQALAGAGMKAEAIARYEEALQIESLPANVRMNCEKSLQELRGDVQ